MQGYWQWYPGQRPHASHGKASSRCIPAAPNSSDELSDGLRAALNAIHAMLRKIKPRFLPLPGYSPGGDLRRRLSGPASRSTKLARSPQERRCPETLGTTTAGGSWSALTARSTTPTDERLHLRLGGFRPAHGGLLAGRSPASGVDRLHR